MMQNNEWNEWFGTPEPPAGLRGLLPLHVYWRRKDGGEREFSWLWMLREDGRLEVVDINAPRLDAEQMEAMLQGLDAQPGADRIELEGVGIVRRLPDAPVLPALLNGTDGAGPIDLESLGAAISAFAAKLDAQILDFLGWVGSQTSFQASVANYNALCTLPLLSRQRRMQALLELPPLLLPLLLSQGVFDMLGLGVNKRPDCPAPVLDAIDQGQDWVEALAQHYRVGRACVDSDVWRDFWEPEACLQELLWRLDAIPAQARPKSREALEIWLPALMALPFTASGGRGLDYRLLGQLFAPGWEKVWRSAGVAPEDLPGVLQKAREFLAAAFDGMDAFDAVKLGSAEAVGVAWLARHGLASLLSASGRWHALPVTRRFEPEEDDLLDVTLRPLMGFYADKGRSARELMTVQALEQEEMQMRDQISAQWWTCLRHGKRIMHLSRPDGEQATAHFRHAMASSSEDGPFWMLEALKGACGVEPSMAMSNWGQRVQQWINRPQNQVLRQAVLEQAMQSQAGECRMGPPIFRRLSDPRSRAELQQVVDWTGEHVRGPALSHVLVQEHVAGTGYTDAEVFFDQMRTGDALGLVREPDNPHDRNAIRIEWQGRKLGYVPKDFNIDLAQRLDRGEPVQARLTAKGDGSGHWVELEFCATLQAP